MFTNLPSIGSVPILSEIPPFRIHRFNEFYLLLPAVFLDLFFSANGIHGIVGGFKVDQPIYIIMFGKTIDQVLFMLADPPGKIAGESYIESLSTIGQNVNEIFLIGCHNEKV